MSPKPGSKWLRWLSPNSLSPSPKEGTAYEVAYGPQLVQDPLKSEILKPNSQPKLILMHHTKISNPNQKGRRMVTLPGSWCCQPFKGFLQDITVEPILFLYMLSTFSQYASFQDLVYSRACIQTYSAHICDNLHSSEYSQESEVIQSKASHLILLSTTALVLPSIFIAIYLGSWSDRFGRKWPIVFPPLGGVLACMVYVVLAYHPSLPIQWIFLASFLSGLFGGFVSCIMSCMSYVSSISTEANRTVRISRLEAMIFLGGTVGPFLSGSMLGVVGHTWSFVFMMGCYAVAFLYAVLRVKEVKDDHDGSDQTPIDRPQSAASSNSVVSSSLKSSTLDSRHLHVDQDLESTEHLLAIAAIQQQDLTLDPSKLHIEENVTNTFQDEHLVYLPCDTPSPYQPLSSGHGQGPSHFEDGSSTAASEDEQRKILKECRNSPEPEDLSCCSRYFGSEHFFAAIKTVAKRREGQRRLYLILTLIAGYLGMMITAGELDVAFLFAKGEPLFWSHKTFSYYFGFKYGLGTLVLLIGMPLFQHFKVGDSTVCVIGLVSRMAGLVLYALSPNTVFAFFVPMVAIFSFFSIPATRSILSKLVSPDEQGKIFAFVAIMEDLCTMTASMMFNSLYPLTRPIHKGFIFLLAAALLVIPVILMWFIGRRLSRIERRDVPQNITEQDKSYCNDNC